MTKIMVSTLFLVAGTAFAGAETVSLATKYTKNGVSGSLYSIREDETQNTGIYTGNLYESATGGSYTITISVADLFGAEEYGSSDIFSLESIDIVGHGQGWFTGDNRMLTVRNGEQSVSASYPSASSAFSTISFSEALTFSVLDTLTVELGTTSSTEKVCLWYAAPAEGVSISGAKIGTTDTYAAVRLNATVSAIPEPSAFGLIAGAGALALVAARRRRKS